MGHEYPQLHHYIFVIYTSLPILLLLLSKCEAQTALYWLGAQLQKSACKGGHENHNPLYN